MIRGGDWLLRGGAFLCKGIDRFLRSRAFFLFHVTEVFLLMVRDRGVLSTWAWSVEDWVRLDEGVFDRLALDGVEEMGSAHSMMDTSS